jgi:hypothetical protein
MAENPQLPPSLRIWAHIRGCYWSAKKDDILFVTPWSRANRPTTTFISFTEPSVRRMFVGGILLKKKARAIKQGVRSAGSGGLQVGGVKLNFKFLPKYHFR